jgi:phage terminase large subunit-like protein
MSALDVLHGLVLDDDRRWGEAAVSWQREDARAVLEPGEGEPRLHWLGRPKGGSKSTDLAGMCIAWLIEQAGPLADGYAVAADKDQANRLLDKARGFIARTSGLDEVLEVQSQRIVNRVNGARVVALEADVASSEGLLTPWIVVDELPNWADTSSARRMWTSVVSAVPKWRGCRLVVIGHAGDPAHWSRKVLDSALRLGWRVVEVPGPLPWMSEADLEMQEAMLLPSEFARRHLNRWTTAEDRLTTGEDLAACVRLDGPQPRYPDRLYVASLDVGLKNDRTAAAVVSVPVVFEGRAPRVRLDRMAVWEGSRDAPVELDAVEAWLWAAVQEYGAPVVVDPYQAAQLTQRLRARGWLVVEHAFTQQSVGRLARRLFQVIADHALELPDDAELLDELANVRLRETAPGVFRMDHDAGRHDDRAIALALGCWALLDSDLLRFDRDPGWTDETELAYLDDAGISPV